MWDPCQLQWGGYIQEAVYDPGDPSPYLFIVLLLSSKVSLGCQTERISVFRGGGGEAGRNLSGGRACVPAPVSADRLDFVHELYRSLTHTPR